METFLTLLNIFCTLVNFAAAMWCFSILSKWTKHERSKKRKNSIFG